MTIKFTNNATTTLASGINSSVTSLTVATGTGALFPSLSGSDVFYVTLANLTGTVEIVKVTARSSDTFTIVRGQDNTTAAAWSTGDKVELRPTAGVLNTFLQQDASGNVGIGVVPSAWTAFKAIEIGGNGAGIAGGTGQPVVFCNAYYNSGWKYSATGVATNYDQVSGAHRWFNAASGTAGNAISFTQAMTLDTSGNLLVGATTTLAGGTGLTVSTDGRSVSATIGIKAHAATGYDARLYMECPGSNAGGLTYQRSTGRLYAYSQTENSGPYVVPNGTSWTTNSDERLKTDIEDIAYGLSAVMELAPKQYKYKTGDKTSLGLIAQQAALVIPEIVEVPEDTEAMMGIEYTGLIPVLVKAIQEQQAIIASQSEAIEQLRVDVAKLKVSNG